MTDGPTAARALDRQEGGDHYRRYPIQPAVFCHRNDLGFIEGSIIKYLLRHASKNGKADLLKARHFLDMLIELEYEK